MCLCVCVVLYCCYLFYGYLLIYSFSWFFGCVILGGLGYLFVVVWFISLFWCGHLVRVRFCLGHLFVGSVVVC